MSMNILSISAIAYFWVELYLLDQGKAVQTNRVTDLSLLVRNEPDEMT
jgi:hypothetical protein